MSLLRNQRHWTHILCWNMQRSFDWSGQPCWEIRGTGLTSYVGTCKSHWLIRTSLLGNQSTGLTSYVGTCKGNLTDQDVPAEKSEALDSHAMLEHAKVIWLTRTSLLRNQRTGLTHYVGTIQKSFDWSGHPSWEIRGTGLTSYVGTCKDHLTDQDILLRNQRHWTHVLCGTCKGHLTDQNIPPEKSEALDSPPMLQHAKLVGLILIRKADNSHRTNTYWLDI